MLEHYVEAYKATDEGRGWVGEEEKADGVAERKRERLFGAQMVCQSSVSFTLQPHKQTLTATVTRHTTTHKGYVHVTKTPCHHILKPSK